MKAGRELDRLVAEKIFDRDPLNARHGLHPDGDIEYHWGYPLGHDIAPRYSTDIAAAWQILDKLRTEDPFGAFVHFTEAMAHIHDADQDCWEADVFNVLGGISPESICLAALEAKP